MDAADISWLSKIICQLRLNVSKLTLVIAYLNDNKEARELKLLKVVSSHELSLVPVINAWTLYYLLRQTIPQVNYPRIKKKWFLFVLLNLVVIMSHLRGPVILYT